MAPQSSSKALLESRLRLSSGPPFATSFDGQPLDLRVHKASKCVLGRETPGKRRPFGVTFSRPFLRLPNTLAFGMPTSPLLNVVPLLGAVFA
jgi:hypothetical protein